MKPVQLLMTVAFAVFVLTIAAWLGRPRTGGSQPGAPQPAASQPDALPIPTAGPFGKAVAKETTFDFGVVEVGDQGSHVFVITNEGPGPLRVKGGGTSCPQCTIGKVSREDDIPPGESVEVEIKWTIKSPAARFRQTADVLTTDPNNKKLVFGIQGIVDSPLHLLPAAWDAGNLSESEPTIVEGFLYSGVVDEIVINRVECSNPLVSVTWEAADPALMSEKQAKSVLKIKVAIAPGTSIGPLRETVKLHTAVRDGIVMELPLSGKRPGPIEVIGRGWNPDNNSVRLGEFPCTSGAKARLTMYVRRMEGELKVEQADSESGQARVTVSPTGKSFGESKIYEVNVEVPPGPPAIHRGKDVECVVLKLNHPTVDEFKMYLDYHAK